MKKLIVLFCLISIFGYTLNAQTPVGPPAGTVSNATPATGTAHGNPGGKTMSYSNTAWPAFSTPCYTYGFRDTLYAAILGDLGAPPSNGPCTGSSDLVYSSALSNLPGGIIVYTGSTNYKYILGSVYAYTTQTLPVRVTIRFTNGAAAPIPVFGFGSAKLIKVTQDFNVNVLFETYSPSDAQYYAPGTPNTWTPSISLFDYLWTDPSRSICTSFNWGSFYTFSVAPTASNAGPYCAGNTINLSSSATTQYGGPLTYSWSGPLSYSDATQNPAISSATTGMTGTYSVAITDALGCIGTATTNVTVNALPVASSSNATVCAGQSGTITASGGGTYLWNTGATTAAITASPASTTSYTVTVTNAAGCSALATGTITVNPNPVATSSAPPIACNGGTSTVTVGASGGTSPYTGTGNFVVPVGTYSYTVTDANGCTNTTTISVTEPTVLAAASSATSIACNGGSATITVSATGGTGPYTGTGNFTVTAGTYSYTVTDANGCTNTTTISVTQPTALAASSSASSIACNGGSATITVAATGGTGPYTGTGNFTVPAGTYSYTVTDANGCTNTTTITVTEPTALTTSSSATSILCNGGSSTVTVAASGGTTPYTGDGNFTVAAGTYSYTVTDANGCTSSTSVTVTEPTVLTTSSSATSILCNGGSSTVTVAASGGTTPYTGDGNFTVAAGTYSYTVTDANGCTSSTSITVTEPTALSASAVTVNVGCNGDSTGSVDLTVTGGTGAYTFDWNSGTYVTEDLSGLGAGTYIGTVTDANGCTATNTVTVTEPTVLSASVTTAVGPTTCGGMDGSLDITVTGGTAGYTYLWDNTATTEDISGLPAGSYSCVITDANGCTASVADILNDPSAPVVTLTFTSDTVCLADAAFTLSGESPAGGTFSGPGVSAGSFDPATAGVGSHMITYTYTDINGCTGSAIDSINVDVCTEVGDANVSSEFVVYPNPNNGMFSLQMNTYAPCSIEIHNAIGQLVAAEKVQDNAPVQFVLSESGIYVVSVIQADGTRTSQRVIVTR